MNKKNILILLFLFFSFVSKSNSKNYKITGTVKENNIPIPYANVYLSKTKIGTVTDNSGKFELLNLSEGLYELEVTYVGYLTYKKSITINKNGKYNFEINLKKSTELLNETVITGTLKPVNRLKTPVPVEIYTDIFLKNNPTPNLFEALQNVNGVRPQINCNVCNTGDIHINGLEGPYTLVLIDGMPIVSSLGTVYGLSGIPNSLVKQIEFVKGPASSLYGSEAVGGLINVITKDVSEAPNLFVDGFMTDWGEYNIDFGSKFNIKKIADILIGVNYFKYDNPIDKNNDNFTDLTLQDRVSIFQKWNFKRKKSRILKVAARYYYEDRWGGEMQWKPIYRGTNEIYGESIYTSRWELMAKYQLPFKENLLLSLSYNSHNQNSVYGDVFYLAKQKIGFLQITWDKKIDKHDLLIGSSLRYNYYNDNTPATKVDNKDKADEFLISSIFVQDEYEFIKKHSILLGIRYDYNNHHGNIFTPRIAYRFKFNKNDIFRINTGTGFRVVNLFTEDHAALTGARKVIIEEDLKPEKSYNININYLKKLYHKNGNFMSIDFSLFYTQFSNQILPDYETNTNQIIYKNLNGKAISQGGSFNFNINFNIGLKLMLGTTYQDVTNTTNGKKTKQILTESFTGVWNISYYINKVYLKIDYNGNLYGPMKLPLLGDLDPRKSKSPTWSIQNVQFTFNKIRNIEFYGGIKNLLNFTPNKGNPFLIARAHDPFDKKVKFDANGNAIKTKENPYALTFDPSYVYAPNQGIRSFFGARYNLVK